MEGAIVERIEVQGGKTTREIAEHLRLQKEITRVGRHNVRNMRMPIGKAREHLLP